MTKNVFFYSLTIAISIIVGVFYTGTQFVKILGESSGVVYYGTQFMFHFGEEMKLLEVGGIGILMVVCKYFTWLIILISSAHAVLSLFSSIFTKKEKNVSKV